MLIVDLRAFELLFCNGKPVANSLGREWLQLRFLPFTFLDFSSQVNKSVAEGGAGAEVDVPSTPAMSLLEMERGSVQMREQ